MQKFIRRLLFFLIPAVCYAILAMFFMPKLLSINNGPSTKQQIDLSFENAVSQEYELLILGNSRSYRGLNPSLFTVRTYNFSHDNDSWNQIYYKLKYLLAHHKKFDDVILNIDYFQFSFMSPTRNYVYADYFKEDYLQDFEERNVWNKKIEYHIGNIDPKNFWNINENRGNYKPHLRSNGQFIREGTAQENDTVTRQIRRLPVQELYFRKTLALCKAKKIQVFLVMLPTRPNELSSYSKEALVEFESFIHQAVDDKNIRYLNYSKIKGFETKDYTDVTHLNERGANRFSKILNDSILKLNK